MARRQAAGAGQRRTALSVAPELAAESSQLQIDSSLQGLRIDLPAPFGKAAGVRRDSTLRMSLQGAERRYSIRHDELAALVFVAPLMPGRRDAASCAGWRCGESTGATGLYVKGRLPELDWNARRAVLDQHGKGDPQQTTGSLLRQVQVDIDRFEGFGTRIDRLGIDLQRGSAAGPSACAVRSSAARCVCRTPMTASS